MSDTAISGNLKRSKAYLITRQKATRTQYALVADLTKDLHPHTHRFFCHVLVSGRVKAWDDGWVPVPAKLIERELRGAEVKALIESRFIEYRPFSRRNRRCGEYRIRPDILDRFVDMGPATAEEAARATYVDLFTGKRWRRKAERSRRFTANGNAFPEAISIALDTIQGCLFDARAVEDHLASLARARDAALDAWRASGAAEGSPEHQAYVRARCRYTNDKSCYDAVLDLGPEHIGDGIWRYRPAYRVQSSGRIGHVGGGLQSCTREMKAAAYGRLKDLGYDVRNYDMKSSQPRILIPHMEEAGIDAGWLRAYVEDSEAKYRYAERVGVTVDVWKRIFNGLLFGAVLPASFERLRRSDGAVAETILNPENVPAHAAREIHRRLLEVIGPFKKALTGWHKHLLEVRLRKYGRVNIRNGKLYIGNAASMTLCIDDIEEPWRRGPILAAFLLQGEEAAFTHALTALGPAYGFTVLANEHDGLVTIGEIPEEAICRAMAESGLSGVQLEEKPFAKPILEGHMPLQEQGEPQHEGQGTKKHTTKTEEHNEGRAPLKREAREKEQCYRESKKDRNRVKVVERKGEESEGGNCRTRRGRQDRAGRQRYSFALSPVPHAAKARHRTVESSISSMTEGWQISRTELPLGPFPAAMIRHLDSAILTGRAAP